jgi:methylated-DNA-[protein]-cysteine S-methyltransferase
MTIFGYTLFDSAIGHCGIAWGDGGIKAIQLPERLDADTRARLLRTAPHAIEATPPPEVQAAIDGIVALLHGVPSDLSDVALDMEGVPPFNRRVYEVTRTILAGSTLTYGAIATRLGEPGAARAVGQALGHNPFVLVVPCHRVLAADGGLGGFSAAGGRVTKLRLLTIEGARTNDEPSLFDDQADGATH